MPEKSIQVQKKYATNLIDLPVSSETYSQSNARAC